MRRLLGLLAALALCGLFAGCGEAEEVDITLKLPPISMVTPSDAEITNTEQFLKKAADAFMAENKNVNIEIELFEYTKEDEAVAGAFDTDDAADILYEGYFNMGTYIHTGRVVPLDDIISDDLRNDVDDSIWNMSSADGKTYMMPFLSLQNMLTYNKELFYECGLDEYVNENVGEIDSWSIEEWEKILDTLAEKLPKGVYPMMMYAGSDQGDTHIMTLIRSHGCGFFDSEGYFDLDTPEGIAGLNWLRGGVERRWYPPQCDNLEIADNTELFSNNQLAIALTNNASFVNFDKTKFGCVNFPGEGEGLATSFVTGFEVFDNGDAKKLETAKEFVKFITENDKWAEYSAGGIPARNSIANKYADDIYMLSACLENNKNVVDFTRNNPNWRGVREVFYPHINELLRGKKTAEETALAIEKDCNAAIDEGKKSSVLHE